MKKVIFKNGFRAFLVAFCFLVLGVVGVNAQSQVLGVVGLVPGMINPATPNTPLYNVPQGTFVSNSEALIKLGIATGQLKDLMATPGVDPSVVDAAMIKARYYGSIAEYIKMGATVPNSIVAGLWMFLTDEAGGISTSTQQSLKNDAINLLQ